MGDSVLDQWFATEVLPLEPILVRFLRRNWSDEAEVADLRQEAYVRVYESATRQIPYLAKPFLFQVVRNLIIDRLRQKSVVSIETIADFELLNVTNDDPSPEHQVEARQQIRLLQLALDELPPRCREVIILRKVEGLSQREVAQRMGITEATVERHVANGVRVLAQSILGTRAPIIARTKRHLSRANLKNR
jgi:RNA polymerase sigma factor (sigma-70 family)